MNNKSFDDKRIAEGYTKDRPFLHAQVIDNLKRDMEIADDFQHGLDVGCGAGLSTKALKMICRKVTGTDISEEMIRVCKKIYDADDYDFMCSMAEETDAEDDTFDIVSAAGVINWVDEEKFLHNLKRIMCNSGLLFIYDFWITDKMIGNMEYTQWYNECYLKNFPKPPRKEYIWRQENIPDFFLIEKQITFELDYEFDLDSFIRFMMIQSNVNAQIEKRDRTEKEIREWFMETLAPIWGNGRQTLVFDGYSWYLRLQK